MSLDLHCCPRRAEASLDALHLAGLPGHHSRQPQPPSNLEPRHQGGRRGLGGANLLIAEPPVWSWLQRRSLRCAPLGSLPIVAGQSSAPASLPSNSSTGLFRPLISPLWRISDPQSRQSLQQRPFRARRSKTGSWLYKRANAATGPKKNVKLKKKANKTISSFFLNFWRNIVRQGMLGNKWLNLRRSKTAPETSCKVLLHEKCMPECQTLLICFWLNVYFFHSTLLLHLALH